LRICCLIGVFLYSLFCHAQDKAYDIHKTYTVEEVREDIDYTAKYLLKFHPDPYRYIPEDSLRAFIDYTKSRITRPLNEMQVRFYIKQIVAKIGCGHTDVAASKAYAKTIVKLSRPIMPLNTFLLDNGKLIVINNLSADTSIVPGDEITAIDGHPTDTILKTIFSIYTTDGRNETCKKRGIRYEWFKYYYSFCYGFKSTYDVSFRNKKGVLCSLKLDAISSLKDTVILPKKDSVTYLQQTRTCHYSILDHSKPVGIIDINGFGGRHWNRFCRRSFKDLRRKGIDHLVIDLRDNGGGKINNGLELMSYLIPKTIKVPFDRKPNLIPFNGRLKMDPGSRITPLLFTFFLPEIPKKGRLRHFFFSFPKHRNRFRGTVYVLVNGKSFSMSCIAAAYLKYKANAIIIGEETGGNVAGSNAIINGSLYLPHTRVKIFVPIYHIYHDIKVENTGHGIMPDYQTLYSKEDILQGVDVDMKKVKELVK
jgi:C-terminal processing protease CtpA/Prc